MAHLLCELGHLAIASRHKLLLRQMRLDARKARIVFTKAHFGFGKIDAQCSRFITFTRLLKTV